MQDKHDARVADVVSLDSDHVDGRRPARLQTPLSHPALYSVLPATTLARDPLPLPALSINQSATTAARRPAWHGRAVQSQSPLQIVWRRYSIRLYNQVKLGWGELGGGGLRCNASSKYNRISFHGRSLARAKNPSIWISGLIKTMTKRYL
jgi:hypothetical protein